MGAISGIWTIVSEILRFNLKTELLLSRSHLNACKLAKFCPFAPGTISIRDRTDPSSMWLLLMVLDDDEPYRVDLTVYDELQNELACSTFELKIFND
jgi:hypothetical protein